jgi:hypothetical protein
MVLGDNAKIIEKRFAELLEFKNEHGHCNVPHREPFLVLHKW